MITISFYVTGLSALDFFNRKFSKENQISVSPVLISIPVLYLFFLVTLNVKHSLVSLFVMAIFFVVFKFRKLNLKDVFVYSLISFVLFLMICQTPLLDWDTRSIWFFHSKIIYYFSGSEMMNYFNRNEIATFSHSDYPKLQPFLSALFAFPFPEWKEQIAKSSLALLWSPVFFQIFKTKDLKIKIILFVTILLLNNGQFFSGLTDWLIASYVLIAFIIYNEDEKKWLDSVIFLSLPILIKAEGLVLTTLGISTILILKSSFQIKALFRNFKFLSFLMIVPVLCFLLWKYHCAKYGIHNYLTNDPSAAILRIKDRLFDHGKSLKIFVDCFGYYNKVIKIMVYLALLRRLMIWKKLIRFEIAIFSFVAIYTVFLFFTYMGTPFDLNWHLSTSIERTAFPIFLLSLVTLLIRDIDLAKRI